MRGRVTLVFFLLFSIAAASFADCSLGITYTGSFRTTAFDVAISGNDLWLATGYGLQLLDRSVDPPALIAYVAVPELTRVVKLRNGIAYAGSGSNLVVAQRNGSKIDVIRSIDAGGSVQAIAIDGTSLYAGTSTGLVRFDLTSPLNPVRSSTLVTSSPSVTSLAIGNSSLFAADGDSSVETFNLASGLPVPAASISSLPRSIGVAVAGTNLLVSDGQASDIFVLTQSGAVKATTTSFGSTSSANLAGSVQFVAGQDRRIVATDLSAAGAPVRLFDEELAPSGGTVNRILAMATAPGRLYVAAGDIGLQVYDTSRFTPPFPLRAYTSAAPGSVAGSELAIYTGTANGLAEFNRGSGTALTPSRTWSSGSTTVHAATGDGFLLSSSGSTLTYWTTRSTTPSAVSTVTYRATVRYATLLNSTVYALLSDGSFWRATLDQQTAAPVAIPLGAARPQSMARSGSGFVFVDVSDSGQTTVRFYQSADFAASPQTATLAGAAVTPVALDGKRAAVFTFRGISIVDFTSTPAVTELPGSSSQLATALAISGNRVLELTTRELISWDLTSRAIERKFALPGDATTLAVIDPTLAAAGTTSGLSVVAFTSSNGQPSLIARANGNTYYRKAALSGDRLLLIAVNRVDQYTLGVSRSPLFVTTIPAAGVIDVAASTAGTFTLAGNGTVSAWTTSGQLIATTTINEGSDAVPLAIHATSGAVFVSISRGCLSGGCAKKTIVYNPATLSTTTSMTGGIVDLVQNGNRAWVITDLPAEIRALDLTDPTRPVITATHPLDGAATSIAYTTGNVSTLGDRLYSYRETDLAATGTQLDAASAEGTFLRTTGSCAVVTQGGSTRLFDAVSPAAWASRGTLALPAPVRSIASSGSRLVILTDYSIEVYSTAPPATPARRKAAK